MGVNVDLGGTMLSMTEPDAQTPIATYGTTALDTPNPRSLAEFYCALLGWEVTDVEEDWVTIRPPGGTAGGLALAFQLAPDHVPPTWPDNSIPQQSHLDLYVPDLDVGEQQVISLGARRTGRPEEPGYFRVYLDPSGHPFCLCEG